MSDTSEVAAGLRRAAARRRRSRQRALIAVGAVATLAAALAGAVLAAGHASPHPTPAGHGALAALASPAPLLDTLRPNRVDVPPGTPSGAPTAPATGPVATAAGGNAATAATVSCHDDTVHDTAALAAAINNATAGSVLTIAAGTCALDANLPVRTAVTIDGAGAQATFLVQHAAENIFQIDAPYVTVENLNLNTAAFNPGPGSPGNPRPAVLFSAQSHTTVRNVAAEAGSGFGMRITGSQPCASYPTIGTVVDNLTISNSGVGGFAALDIDCTNGAQLHNIRVRGDYIALYQDENVSLTGESYTPDARACQPPWYVTGPARNIVIDHIQSSAGHGVISGPAVNVLATNQLAGVGCP